jgi:DNA-binding winged helix-turn-helix (wHTH) protein
MDAQQTVARSLRQRYFFGDVEFEPDSFELRVAGEKVTIERRPLCLLHVLLQHPDRVVTYEELKQLAWEGRITVQNVLPNAMTKLRKALGQDGKLIETVPRIGYRVSGPVQVRTVAPARLAYSQSLSPRRAFASLSFSSRLKTFRAHAEAVARRHATGVTYNAISKADLELVGHECLLLLSHRPLEATPLITEMDPYRPPEIFRGRPVSVRSDIYSLGVILYQMIVGDFGRPLLPDWFQDVEHERCRQAIAAATAADPMQRPGSVDELLLALLDEPSLEKHA